VGFFECWGVSGRRVDDGRGKKKRGVSELIGDKARIQSTYGLQKGRVRSPREMHHPSLSVHSHHHRLGQPQLAQVAPAEVLAAQGVADATAARHGVGGGGRGREGQARSKEEGGGGRDGREAGGGGLLLRGLRGRGRA
jgi:hypothetical protein